MRVISLVSSFFIVAATVAGWPVLSYGQETTAREKLAVGDVLEIDITAQELISRRVEDGEPEQAEWTTRLLLRDCVEEVDEAGEVVRFRRHFEKAVTGPEAGDDEEQQLAPLPLQGQQVLFERLGRYPSSYYPEAERPYVWTPGPLVPLNPDHQTQYLYACLVPYDRATWRSELGNRADGLEKVSPAAGWPKESASWPQLVRELLDELGDYGRSGRTPTRYGKLPEISRVQWCLEKAGSAAPTGEVTLELRFQVRHQGSPAQEILLTLNQSVRRSSKPLPAPSREEPTSADTGWHGQPMPKGMSRSSEEDVYLWDTGKGLKMEMLYVPPGDFAMGSDDYIEWCDHGKDDKCNHDKPDERDRADNNPRHTHPMPYGYYIGRCETTWGEYRDFCRATKRDVPREPYALRVLDNHPVVNVSWQDAQEFCDWAGLSLPTEAMWEKAARGTKGTEYPWGDEPPSNRCRLGLNTAGPSPVGRYRHGASPYGALDMAGNVWEWCADWYELRAYLRYEKGQLAPPASGKERVVRGGAWSGPEVVVRSARRSKREPASVHQDYGFRPARISGRR
ncbi:formylglycine-generating enzyme family protein [Planctomycetota bacterium]